MAEQSSESMPEDVQVAFREAIRLYADWKFGGAERALSFRGETPAVKQSGATVGSIPRAGGSVRRSQIDPRRRGLSRRTLECRLFRYSFSAGPRIACNTADAFLHFAADVFHRAFDAIRVHSLIFRVKEGTRRFEERFRTQNSPSWVRGEWQGPCSLPVSMGPTNQHGNEEGFGAFHHSDAEAHLQPPAQVDFPV